MVYYIYIENNKINGSGQAKIIDENINNFEVDEIEYNNFIENPEKYVWDETTQTIINNPNYEQEQAQKEAQRVALLNLTGADVERAIYKAKGMDFDDIITFLEAQPLAEDGTPQVDIKALKIELKANNFYRGNPYIDTVGTLLGFTKEQLDEFFETNDYTKLITQTPSETPTEEPETQPTEEPETT